MTTNYSVRSSNKKKPVTIYLRVRETGISWYFATPFSIMLRLWNRKRGIPFPGKTVEEQTELRILTAKLTDLEKAVSLFVEQCRIKKRIYTRDDIKTIVNNSGNSLSQYNNVPYHILDYIDYLISGMKSGSFKFHSARYDEHTIKVWKNFRNIYSLFEKNLEKKSGKILGWESIDKSVYDAFIDFCEECGYMSKTINKLIVCFKAAINYSANYHCLHNNLSCLRHFSKIRIIRGSARTKVYLTAVELNALFSMPLPPGSLKDKVRDIFLIGCFTGQRISDYGYLTPANFTYTSNGTKVISILQEKTNNYILIPVLTDKLEYIVEKYNYKIPRVSEVIINRYIKQICKELSITVPSLAEKITTPLTMRELKAEKEGRMSFEYDENGNAIKPKYMMISTHTARRTTITNLYKSQLFNTFQMMSISGHKSESTFWAYLSASTEEVAEEIAALKQKYYEEHNAVNHGFF